MAWGDTRNLKELEGVLDGPETVLTVEKHVESVGPRPSAGRHHHVGPSVRPVLVDSVFATPYHARLAALRADLVAHSLTKFMAGHSDRILGVMVGSQARLTER